MATGEASRLVRLAAPVCAALMAACSAPAPVVAPPTDTTEVADTAYAAGTSYYGANRYIEYIAGDMPVILSAAHGGDLTPAGMPDRTPGRCGGSATTVTDLNTRDLVLEMQRALHDRFGAYPHVVINHLHRRKLDANRALTEAACGNERASEAWHEFQAYLDRSRDAVAQRHGRGWYMDIHGHGHAIQRLELGYLLDREALNSDDEVLAAADDTRRTSSISSLAAASPRTFPEVLRGAGSLGALFAAEGYPAVPGPDDPRPEDTPYFTGGYNTRRHTCGAAATPLGGDADGPVCGVQIEANFEGVRDSEAGRAAFAAAAAAVLEEYLSLHWDIELAPATN